MATLTSQERTYQHLVDARLDPEHTSVRQMMLLGTLGNCVRSGWCHSRCLAVRQLFANDA